MRDLILLPATEPDDDTYGFTPGGMPGWRLHIIDFPRMVWYNAEVRRDAAARVTALDVTDAVLVGFSKSGLGALNMTAELSATDLGSAVTATVVFDAPVCHQASRWPNEAFYDPQTWAADLPLNCVDRFVREIPGAHQLVLHSGASFHDDMQSYAHELERRRCPHTFIADPRRAHHWDSGWLPACLARLHR